MNTKAEMIQLNNRRGSQQRRHPFHFQTISSFQWNLTVGNAFKN